MLLDNYDCDVKFGQSMYIRVAQGIKSFCTFWGPIKWQNFFHLLYEGGKKYNNGL